MCSPATRLSRSHQPTIDDVDPLYGLHDFHVNMCVSPVLKVRPASWAHDGVAVCWLALHECAHSQNAEVVGQAVLGERVPEDRR